MKIGVVHPDLMLKGGGEYVTLEIMQALRDGNDLELISFRAPDVEELNDFFDTDLDDEDFSTLVPPVSRFLKYTGSFFKLRNFLVKRYAKKNAEDYDLLISGLNEADFPGKQMQYVHFPDAVNEQHFHETGEVSTEQSLGATGVYRLYTKLVDKFVSYDNEEVANNVTFCNSEFTKKVFEESYESEAEVLNPPVSIEFEEIHSWPERRQRFTCIGRISPPKRQKELIEIIDRLREKGYRVGLDIVGKVPDTGYASEVEKLAEERDYVKIHGSLSREEMKEIMKQNRFGIHGFPGEHYGLAPAEMLKAGSIVFVPNRGGQIEIIEDDRLIYSDVDDAVEKISDVLDDKSEVEELREKVSEQSDKLNSPEEFRKSIRKKVELEMN